MNEADLEEDRVIRERTWTWAEGEGELRLSEKEAMAHIRARIVKANVSKALALYPKECIFPSSSSSSCLVF